MSEYKQRVFEPHNVMGYRMRVMRVINEHRGGTCDDTLSFVLRVESKTQG